MLIPKNVLRSYKPICLSLGLGPGQVETLPNIIIKPNSLCLSTGIGLGIGVEQCKWAITPDTETDCRNTIWDRNPEWRRRRFQLVEPITTNCTNDKYDIHVLNDKINPSTFRLLGLCNQSLPLPDDSIFSARVIPRFSASFKCDSLRLSATMAANSRGVSGAAAAVSARWKYNKYSVKKGWSSCVAWKAIQGFR